MSELDSDIAEKALNLSRGGFGIQEIADSIGLERLELRLHFGNEIQKFAQRVVSEQTIRDYFGFDDEEWESLSSFYKAGRAHAEIRARDSLFKASLEKKDVKTLSRLLEDIASN